jgi:4a-hydroxytetrahydrobiopterin dehydratase
MRQEWREQNQTLEKQFTFENFSQALTFVNQVGEICEELDHHPNIMMHDYKYVTISTTTHDAGNSLTQLDHTLAKRVDELVENSN